MYEDVKISQRHKRNMTTLVNAAINNYNESIAPEKSTKYKSNYEKEANSILESVGIKANTTSRYHTFSETVRTSLLTEAIYKIFSESTPNYIRDVPENRNIMRAIVSEYVNEHGYNDIMSRMKKASNTMSSIHNVIVESSRAILEDVDKTNPETFTIDMDDKDEFFKQLEYNNADSVTDAICDRVSDTIEDFVTANTKDHEDITAALKQAQEKIDNVDPNNEELKEYYQSKAKRYINEINNAPKSVFHSMVTAMCEGIMKDKSSHAEFITEGHLNMDKIVNRVRIMYTFMEMLNTSRLDTIDEVFIETTISDLKK